MDEKSTKIIQLTQSAISMNKFSKDSRQITLFSWFGNFNGNLDYLVDTGAEVSLVKLSSINDIVQVSQTEFIPLNSLSPYTSDLFTLGTCINQVKLNDKIVKHQFHVVNDNQVNLRQNALLGIDLIQKHNLIINFVNRKIQ